MSTTNSTNMNLPIPGVGTEPGPDFATDINAALTLIDSHDHSPGYGVQITPDGLNINEELTFNDNFAVDVAGVTFIAQGSTPGIHTIYESSNDLYFVDGVGNNVRITQNGAVAGTPGSIANLVSPASASYVALSSKFVWESNTNIAANMDFGAAIMRNLTPNSTYALTLQPPASLAADFTVTLPTLPLATNFLTITSTGTMAGSIPINQGITASNIANATITTSQISATAGILGSQLSASAAIQGSQIDADSAWHTLTYAVQYTFTVTAATAAAGDTYTNNSQTFTVLTTIAGGTTLVCSGTNNPASSGNLVRATGSGTNPIAFSAVTQNQTWTVPAGVNVIEAEAVGGGGGGGGGSNSGTSGGGGEGAIGSTRQIPVTPAGTVTISVGVGGKAGAHGASGADGTTGSDTTITSGATTYTFRGACFGGGGSGGGVGGGTVSNTLSAQTPTAGYAHGGNGHVASGGTGGDKAQGSPYGEGGASGTGQASGGGGGGGMADGGAGGNGGATATVGSPGSLGSGGGGGGGNSATAANGGKGGDGFVTITWFGPTT